MATKFASEKRAHGFCDRCAQRYPLKKLKTYLIKGHIVNMRVCPSCRDPDHPLNWLGILGAQKVANDPQALRNPRPDNSMADSRTLTGTNPVPLVAMTQQKVYSSINSVTITVS